MTHSQKKTVDIVAPTLVSGGVVWYLFGKYKDWRILVAGAVVAWVIVYIIVSQITKVAQVNGPAPVPTGGGCDDYDPKALTDAIYKDVSCNFCLRDKQLYTTLLGLADCQLRKVYNYWNATYYNENNQSLPVAIADESSWLDSQFGFQQDAIKAKFQTLNLQ